MKRAAVLASCVLGLCGLGCEEPPPPAPYPVTFAAISDPGMPLAGVQLSANGAAIGVTAADGSLRVELSGPEGSSVPISATCPAGHREASAIAPLVLRRVTDLTTGATAALQVSVACPPSVRRGIVVVRAGGEGPREGIPVQIDGREVARTDRSGTAHITLEMAPGAPFQVTLATSTVLPNLRPSDPSLPFSFPDHDEIFVFDRPFEVEAPPPPPRPVRHTPRPAAPSLPTVIIPRNLGRGR